MKPLLSLLFSPRLPALNRAWRAWFPIIAMSACAGAVWETDWQSLGRLLLSVAGFTVAIPALFAGPGYQILVRQLRYSGQTNAWGRFSWWVLLGGVGLFLFRNVFALAANKALLLSILLMIISAQLNALACMRAIFSNRRALGWLQFPFFSWALLVSSLFLLIGFLPLEQALLLELSGREAAAPIVSLFFPLSLLLAIPSFAVVAEVLAPLARKTLHAYWAIVGSLWFLGGMASILWFHFLTQPFTPDSIESFVRLALVLIALPAGIWLTVFGVGVHLWQLPLPPSAFFAIGFFPMLMVGQWRALLVGASGAAVTQIHLPYHFFPAIWFALTAAVYHWYPAVTQRQLSMKLGWLHFALTTCSVASAVVFPSLAHISVGLFAAAQLPFGWAVWSALRAPVAKKEINPWHATTAEWEATPIGYQPYTYD